MSFSLDDPPNSRLFVVAGRNTSSDFLKSVFEQYGQVSFVKYLRDKGVAYVKYDRASSAALAIENLHEVTLNEGHGPRLKVMLAESPHSRSVPAMHMRRPEEEEASLDPDNTPPRSRLFLVVPKNADGMVIEAEMAQFAGMQYCKTDLISSKGIVFVKYATSSAACMAMEAVQMGGMVAGYKVKIMLAEPKTRRVDSTPGFLGGMSNGGRPMPPGHGQLLPAGFAPTGPGAPLLQSITPSLLAPGMALQDFSSLQSAVGSLSGGFSGMSGSGLRGPGAPQLDMGPTLSGGFTGLGGLGHDYMGGLGGSGSAGISGLDLGPVPQLSGLLAPQQQHQSSMDYNRRDFQAPAPEGVPNTRLFVVVHKGATEEALDALFRCYPGMEYLDLKRDRVNGRSKGYAYVNFFSQGAAAAAQSQLNGIEYPPGSGSKLKVLFAEPLGSLPRAQSGGEMGNGSMGPGGSSVNGGGSLSSPETSASTFRLSSPHSHIAMSDPAAAGRHLQSAQQQLQQQHEQQQQQQQQQASLSGGHSSGASRENLMLSPHSSPLRLSSADAAGMASLLLEGRQVGELAGGLGNLSLGVGLNNGSQGRVSQASGSDGSRSGGDGSPWRETSPEQFTTTSPNSSMGMNVALDDATVVYSSLSRPLPVYTLAHVFQQCGKVEFVRVLPDAHVAMVKFSSPEGAALALGSLNGVEVLGEVMQVRSSPPLSAGAVQSPRSQ